MNLMTAMNVSASGLAAQRVRVNLASSNIANAESTRGADGKPYARLDPVLEATPMGEDGPSGVSVEVVADKSGGKQIYLPTHPDADASGMVTLPNVDPVHEVVNLMSAQRGFEANATAFEAAKTMAMRALDIIR